MRSEAARSAAGFIPRFGKCGRNRKFTNRLAGTPLQHRGRPHSEFSDSVIKPTISAGVCSGFDLGGLCPGHESGDRADGKGRPSSATSYAAGRTARTLGLEISSNRLIEKTHVFPQLGKS